MQLLPWRNMKPTYLERFIWRLELDVTLAGRVPATDGQVVWQILIPRRFPIDRCHFGLNRSYIWMLCMPIKPDLYSLLTLYPHLPFYTFQLFILYHLYIATVPSRYRALTTMLSCIWRSIFSLLLAARNKASVCWISIKKLKLKGTDFLFVALTYKVQVWQD